MAGRSRDQQSSGVDAGVEKAGARKSQQGDQGPGDPLVESVSSVRQSGTPGEESQAAQLGNLLCFRSEGRDELLLEPVNHRWLRVAWELSFKTLERVVSAMGVNRHRSEPVLRLFRVLCDDSGPRSKEHIVDLRLPVDAEEWFVDVPELGQSWQVELGYLSGKGQFFPLLRSVSQELPMPRLTDMAACGGDDVESLLGPTADTSGDLVLSIGGEIVVNGQTLSGALLVIDDTEVGVDSVTGQFQWKMPLAAGRQVVPFVAETKRQKQRAVLAVETHIRYLELESTGGE